MHALVWDGDGSSGTAPVVQRRLCTAGRALRAGYVEGVGVRADQRRRGHGEAMMARSSASSAAPTTSARSARPTRRARSTRARLAALGRPAVRADAGRRRPHAGGGGRLFVLACGVALDLAAS